MKENAFYKVPLLPEDRRYADIDGMKMKAVVREAAAISRRDKARGTLFWGRNVGFQGHAETQDWVEGYFRKFGLENVHRKSFDLAPQWTAKSFAISFSSGGTSLRAEDGAAGRGLALYTTPAAWSSRSSGSTPAPPQTSSAATSGARRC